MITFAIIISVIAASMTLGGAFLLKTKLVGASQVQSKSSRSSIDETTKKIRELISYAPTYVSKGQIEFVESSLAQETDNLTKERGKLKEVETRLETAQKMVEEKEGSQQESKSARDEDEQKLKELLAAYETISGESIALEKRLANSMKNLETMLKEVKMTEAQKAILTELLNALTEASARLRELLLEYQAINDRLQSLQQQHLDLEEEYTKLVEQQLGE